MEYRVGKKMRTRRQKEKRQKKYPRINSRVKVGSSKDYLSLLRKSSRLVYSLPSYTTQAFHEPKLS